ncbi:hypothetical protein HDU84_009021 [Entophlyctis sp. JEL0112]|nr:hypothetical protein HDU84_009021 [Entophlyctis sp. JEL0112]
MLYLTHFLGLNSKALQNPDNLMLVLESLHASLASAQVIVELASWLLHEKDSVHEIDMHGDSFRRWFWKNHGFSSMMLFEAVIVLWFSTCRTQAFWFDYVDAENEKSLEYSALHMNLEDRRRIRSQVMDVLRTLCDLEDDMSASKKKSPLVQEAGFDGGKFSSLLTPMIMCTNAMIDEMEEMEARLTGNIPLGMHSGPNQDELLVRLTVVSISDSEPEKLEGHTAQPWALLGLIGVKVRNLRWNAFYEDEWREFWQQVHRSEQAEE